VTHLSDAYFTMIMQSENVGQDMKDDVSKHYIEGLKAATVLAPVEVVPPVKPPLVTLYPSTIMARPVYMPTAPFVGDDHGGGINAPYSTGPVALMTLPPVIGTMLIMIAGRVAVSIAVRGATDLYNGLKLKYHRRDAKLRVHTGVGRKGLGRKKTELRDGFDPSLPDGSDRVQPRGDAHPGDYDLDNWDDVPILGGPALSWGPVAHEWINSYGPEFGSWL